MAKSPNQKGKLLYLMQILLQETDEDHALCMNELLEKLTAYDIEAERKSIYSDIEILRSFGLDIIGDKRGKRYVYYVGSRSFELAELKLLVDSVQSAKFITTKKSNELIKKIEGLTSKYEAKKLQRQVYVAERIKTMNESIYYNVDAIQEAISDNRQIRFQYFQWNVKKEMELRHDGAFYQVSPWALTWDNENYYLIAYDAGEGQIRHYRVDKMLHISDTEDRREGKEAFQACDMAAYTRKMFSMYAGREETVVIRCENFLSGAVVDRFGKDVSMRKDDEAHFLARVKVAVSPQFLHWVMALGDGAKIVSPQSVVDDVHAEIARLTSQYES